MRGCHCSAEHKGSCQTKPDVSQISGLRVIDTRQRCLTIAPAACRYAALSYVWGFMSSLLRATTANIDHLAKEGSLNSDILPQTIDDAIVACRKLGIDYLWVDCLCILQDDPPDTKAYWLNYMGEIYAQSYVTIVALAGENSKHGLPGVNKVTRQAYWVGTVQGIYLISTPPDYHDCLRNSKWITRGWTFQEATLSTRLLLFSDTRTFYECRYARFTQDEIYDSGSNFVRFAGSTQRSYKEVVENFTKRDLTLESDVLRAFAGVLHKGWGPECYYGLPLDMNIFRDAILWTTWGKQYLTRHAASGDVFPTWSWSSVRGPVRIEPPDRAIYMERTFRASLATWAIPSRLSQGPSLQVVANTQGKSEGLLDAEEKRLRSAKIVYESGKATMDYVAEPSIFSTKWSGQPCMRELMQVRLAVVIAWRWGCFSGALPSILNTESTWQEYENIVGRWRSLAQLCDEAHGMPQGNMSEEEIDARFPLKMHQDCPPGSIFVYTQSLHINPLKLSLKRWSFNKETFVIEGGDFVAQAIPGSINMERINHVRQQNPHSLFHLLALSVTPHDNMNSMVVGHEDKDFWYDSAGQSLYEFVPFLEVELMLVETEHDVSRRVGLARAYLKHWINQDPQFRAFHLV